MGDALPEGTVEGGDRGRIFRYSRDVRGDIVGEEVSTESGEDGGSEEEDGGSDKSEEESITDEWSGMRQCDNAIMRQSVVVNELVVDQ